MATRSSVEVAYKAMVLTTHEPMRLNHIFELIQMNFNLSQSRCDNNASKPVFYKRTKYIEIDYHFIRDKTHSSLSHHYLQMNYEPRGSHLCIASSELMIYTLQLEG